MSCLRIYDLNKAEATERPLGSILGVISDVKALRSGKNSSIVVDDERV